MHFVMVGVTAPSHIYPSLSLIRELVLRGHRVSYVVGDRLADLVALTGAEVIGHPSILPDSETAWPEDPGEAMQLFLDESIAVLPRLLETVEAPDAVLYDIGGLSGRVAAHRWNVPAVQLSPSHVKWQGYDDEMAEFYEGLKASPSGGRYYTSVRDWLDEFGITLDADTFLGDPDSCVALIPRQMQPHADSVDARYVFTGPCIDFSRMGQPAPSRTGSDGELPLIYVAMGTAYTDNLDLYLTCIEALAGDHRLVIATGKVDPDRLGPLPQGVHAARRQPQLALLEQADVFVTHAGMGSASEALWFGVPMVAVPQAVDQFMNADQVQACGAGVHLPAPEVNAETMKRAVVSARECTPRALELKTEVRAAGGVTASADAVERSVARGLPDRTGR